MRVLGGVVVVVLALALPSPAQAGCSDGACGRVDWTEITSFAGTRPAAAKLHGSYAWESSNAWSDGHPIGGKLGGFVWLSCASGDGTCQDLLLVELSKAGRDQPLYFGGSFYDYQAKQAIQPPILYAEGQAGTPTPLAGALLGTRPMNGDVCPTAFALAPAGGDGGPVDGAVAADASASGLPDDSACAVGRRGSPAGALLAAALLLLVVRRRRA